MKASGPSRQTWRRSPRAAPSSIIAHRLSTVRSAHRILTIDKGRVVEDGTHDQLLKSGGRYATLHSIQAGLYEAS